MSRERPRRHRSARFAGGVRHGFYFLVDNTYSSTFPQVTGDIEDDKFVIHRAATMSTMFGGDWRPAVPGT